MSTRTIPVMFLIIKKEQTYTYFKFNLQNTSKFGLSLTCYKHKGWFSLTPILELWVFNSPHAWNSHSSLKLTDYRSPFPSTFRPFSPWHDSPYLAKTYSSKLHDHTQTNHTQQDSSGRAIIPTQRPLPDNIQQSLETDTHAPGGIRIHNSSKRAAADPRLRTRGHWDRLRPN